ncbi:MAG: amino acid permease, partial [Actinomycetales bacterium]
MGEVQQRASGIGIPAAIALGVGAMMGSGIFTLLGLAGRTSGPLIPVAFLVAAFAASFSVYSYARLGGAFPSRGGAAGFLRAGLGSGVLSGGFNVFQFLGYLFATALYAAG